MAETKTDQKIQPRGHDMGIRDVPATCVNLKCVIVTSSYDVFPCCCGGNDAIAIMPTASSDQHEEAGRESSVGLTMGFKYMKIRSKVNLYSNTTQFTGLVALSKGKIPSRRKYRVPRAPKLSSLRI
jgi:hypothetical protein